MKEPAIPSNEQARIRALESYEILDTIPESDFDEITQLASEVCRTPISLITLIDIDRQWFKSNIGINDNETPRRSAFCAHAINNPNEIMIVPDAKKDERFHDNPYVVGDPHVMFYAGVPLITPDGYALGTLCVIDNNTRELTPLQLRTLKVLANQVIKLFELRKLNLRLQKAREELKTRNDELRQFNYVVSHDLKEPLRSVSSFLQLIKQEADEKLSEQANDYIQFAIDGGKRMGNLISDLLEYATIGYDESLKEEIDTNQLLEEVRKNLQAVITEQQARIQIENIPKKIVGNRSELTRLFQNLISNAIKFRKKSILPEVQITGSTTPTHCHIKISDNGIGIDNRYKQKIFNAFSRLNKRSEYAGSGVGLAICEKIVKNHGGKIWVESELNLGSTFHFTLKMD